MSIRYHIWSIVKILGWKLKSTCGCLRENPVMTASTVQDTNDHKAEGTDFSVPSAEKTAKTLKKGCRTTKSVTFQIKETDAVPKATNSYGKLPYSTVQLKVAMHCEGCKQKVIRVLSKMDEVKQINISMQKQKVGVSGYIDPQMVVETIQKTGKRVEIWSDYDADQSEHVQSNTWKSIEALPALSESSVADELEDKHATEKVPCMQQKSQLSNDDPGSSCKQVYPHQKEAATESSTPFDSHSKLPSPLSCDPPKCQESMKSSEHEAEKLEKKPSKEDVPSQTTANLSNPVMDQLLHREEAALLQQNEAGALQEKTKETASSLSNPAMDQLLHTEEAAPLQPNEAGALQGKKKEKTNSSEGDGLQNLSLASSDFHSLHPDQHMTQGDEINSDSYGNTLTSRLISSADELLRELLTGRLMKAREAVRSFEKTKQDDGSNPTTNNTAFLQSEGSNCKSSVSQVSGRSDVQEIGIHKVLPSVTDVLVLLPSFNNRSGRYLHETQKPYTQSFQGAKPSDSSIPVHVHQKDASCQTVSRQRKAPPDSAPKPVNFPTK